MKNRIFLLFLSLFFILATGNAWQVSACSCRKAASVCEAYGAAKAVFVGQVVGEGTQADNETSGFLRRSFRFTVKEAFLGAETGGDITINTGSGGGDCGFYFEKDKTYLVYAYESEGRLTTNICTRTRQIGRAEGEDFEFLRNLPKQSSGAKIYGNVEIYAKSSLENDSRQPMPKLKMIAVQKDGNREKFEAVTDEKGNYELKDLPAGKYTVLPLPPDYLKISQDQLTEFSLNDKGCADKDFYVTNNNLISVKVIDSDGDPVVLVTVEFIPVGIEPTTGFIDESSSTNSIGISWYHNLPPGKYTVIVNRSGFPGSPHPFPSVFYPGTTDRAEAKIIEIGFGTKIDEILIQLPPILSKKEVSGKVLFENGKPVEKAYVSLIDSQTGMSIGGAQTGSDGKFVVKGYTGRKYTLEASLTELVGDKYVRTEAEAATFTLNEKTGEFNFILKKKVKE